MNRNTVIGIVVVLALIVVGGAYFFLMPKPEDVPEDVTPSESVNDVAVPDEEAAVTLAGTWKSRQDARFIRMFTATGVVTDRYEGDDSATVSGTWSFVDPAKEQAELPVVKDAKVIKVQFPEEVMYFAVTELSETNLTMIYLTGNGTLEFTRI
jgi:hypothetical protein